MKNNCGASSIVQFKRYSFVFVWVMALLLAGNAWCADDSLPPEVKALIGIKIPPKEPGVQGDIPEWVDLWGSGIVNSIYFEVIQRGNITILAIESIDRKEQSRSILDARVIPGDILQFYLKDGKLEWKKNEMQMYRISETCWGDHPKDKEIIIGLWRHEPNSKCADSSTLVKKAWLLSPENGRLTDIPTNGISCREPICGED